MQTFRDAGRQVLVFFMFVLPGCSCLRAEGQTPVSSGARPAFVTAPQARATSNATCPPTVNHAGDSIDALAWSPDGEWLATAGSDHRPAPAASPTHVTLRNALTGNVLRRWETKYPVTQILFRPGGEQLATVDRKGNVQVADYRSGRELYEAAGSPLAYSADGSVWGAGVYSKSRRGQSEHGKIAIEIHEATTGKRLRTIDASPLNNINTLVVTRDGMVLASGCTSEDDDCEGSVEGWEIATGKLVKNYNIEGRELSPDGHWAADIDATAGKLRIFDLSNGKLKADIPLRNSRTQSTAAFSGDGQSVALAQYDQVQAGDYSVVIDLFSLSTGKKTATLQGAPHGDDKDVRILPNSSPSGLRALAFSADGKRVAAANYLITAQKSVTCGSVHLNVTTLYSLLKIWDATMGHELLTLGGQASQ